KIIEAARLSIENEKTAAIADIKDQVATFSVEIAEKILKQKLAGKEDQKELIDKLLNEIRFN
ncbi:MAG: F0F1 ATP synthase subunit B, partial [Bacteroidales bacterium]|nr:F0F1 ATP synthase subunit B [Bacteroidales bacterium]